MQTSITARHIDLTEEFKVHVNEKLAKLNRYSNRIEDVHVVFSSERFNYVSEIVLSGKRFRMAATEKAEGIGASFDKCAKNIENQLKKLRARIKEHKPSRFLAGLRKLSRKGRQARQLQPKAEIIKTDSFATKPMSPEEAALELEVFKEEFIAFRNSSNDKVNVIYRRKDGNYGLIEI
ncbi:MAG: ribosome-associated translation inhibitor RaiA [Candidatus Omnitrophica bacterium]|nr:ribosome-associated translation inhibitor RaiA [Candidatus Omnitrophota bacterium]